ncbi:MAG: PQQ-dependent sugar dehydrogenase [Candidatus Binatia bacterium]|nr:PQQ-dependent sugar dehydrogenase [Candidatus Binatia bacterium]
MFLALVATVFLVVRGAGIDLASMVSELRPGSGAKFPEKRAAPKLRALRSLGNNADSFVPEQLFEDLEFRNVLFATQAREDEPLYILEQQGAVWALSTDGSGTRTKVLDLEDRVFYEHGSESGALGLALRPDSNELYLRYVTQRDGMLYDRVSRFDWQDGEVDAASEEVLIDQLHEWHRKRKFGEHFGGGLVFGPDGYLYVALGDEGWVPERDSPQKIHKDLFSGILRIDVDCTPGKSHPPPRQPESGTTRGYCIPDDNPFVGVPNALEEFYLIGLRNPYRFSFDRESGQLWLGDSGSDLAEEVNIGVPGGNYQWSYREGVDKYTASFLKGTKPRPFIGKEQPPLFAYPHGNGNSCIIGGYVYRGTEHPDLVGRYIFGDINSGRIWALLSDGAGQVLSVERVAQVTPYSLLSFSERADGELLLVGRESLGISKLSETDRDQRPPPPLSKTRLFKDLVTLEPANGVVPYELNVPSWSDGAVKRHWVAIPGNGSNTGGKAKRDRVLYRRKGPWGFPAGSVFIQHFELPIDETDPSRTQRVETRMLGLSRRGGAFTASYRWNDDGTEAFLVTERATTEVAVRTKDGGKRIESWTHPAPSDCLTCHHLGAGYVLGVNARQLDRTTTYGEDGTATPQLEAWGQAGMFTISELMLREPDQKAFTRLKTLAPPDAEGASLNGRARSYLDANCSFCHGPAGALFDLRREAALDPLLDRPVRHDFGHEGARLIVPGDPERSLLYQRLASEKPSKMMPPLGRSHADPAGVALIHEWIEQMKPTN